jgi:hypothetical protein
MSTDCENIPKTLIPTECITYPRSGHHALTQVLSAYFGDNFYYCEMYRDCPLVIGPTTPTNWQKNHDFGLTTPVLPERNYIVQVRNPLESIESWDKLDRRLVGETTDTQENRVDFWAGFVKKWVLAPIPHRLVVWYEDLMERPLSTVTSVVQFVTRTQNVDVAKIQKALREFPLVRRTQTCPTRYNKA